MIEKMVIQKRTVGIALISILATLVLGAIIVWASGSVTDSFTDEMKIESKANVTVDTTTGQVSLALWSCGGSFTDARDAQTYTTVQIGDQCWMAENMNIGTRINGSEDMADNGTIEKYCYSDNEANCDTYGGLYQWDETMQYGASCNGTGAPPDDECTTPVQGICPDGWHIPSHYEYTTLERAVCDSGTCETDFPYNTSTTGWRGTNEGTRLKENGTSGFEGLLAGSRYTNGSFYNDGLGSGGFFWSSLESGSHAWRRRLNSSEEGVNRGAGDKMYGFPVRCVKN